MQRTDPFGWVGSLIDNKFMIEEVAGAGGFGIVYRGVHLGFELPVAVKCLQIPPGIDEEKRSGLLSQFRKEARLLHQLSRRTANIVQALDIGAATAPNGQWTPYIVMEWLEGETLASNLKRQNDEGAQPRGLGATIRLLAPAARALAIAHEEGVSHRDIKPANLFLAKVGGNTTLKILDFGIAKVLSEATLLRDLLTQSGAPRQPFTPQYGAPEQFSGRFGSTGPWTDVFAMTLTLLEVASGRHALEGDDVIQLFTAATELSTGRSLEDRAVHASPAVEAVLARALAPHAKHRFRDLGTMWAALEAAHGGDAAPEGPSNVTPAGSPGEGERPARRGAFESSPTGENRVCTVMFVDLVEATGLSARLGAETAKEVVDRCLSVVKEQVEEMGGVVEELPGGDRSMAIFGVPRATDNDAERAVLAATRIQAAIGRVALPRALRATHLSARVGITTGRVFAELTGPGPHPRLTVVGEAVHVASKLQQAAPSGAVVIGRDTYRQVMNLFNVQPLASVEITGQREALPAYRVLGPLAFRPLMARSEFYGVATKLMGRAAEMARLTDALETMLVERRAGLVTLVGPAGVGRSRMLAALFASLLVRRERFVVMMAQCSPLFRSTPYALVTTLIRQRFDITEADAPGTVKRKLRRGLRWLRGQEAKRRRQTDREGSPSMHLSEAEALDPAELDDALNQLAAVLGTASADGQTQPQSITLEESGNPAKQRLFAAAARVLRAAASATPIVILCDDVQWADGASLELLDELLLRAEDLPVLAVCAARPDLFEWLPGFCEGRAAHARVDLAPLARRHMEEMARDWLRRVPALSPSVVRTLADRAEGLPLILAETLHLLVDAGVIEARGEEAWRVHEEQLGTLALPATVQGIAQARLDRIEAEPRRILEQAAVVGRTFWEGAVARLTPREMQSATATTHLGLRALLRHRQLIRTREPSMFPGEREYVFAESAMHEVAYETLSLKIRRPMHRAIARWLEERAAGAAGTALLALHYDRGGDARRAAAAYIRAASYATSLGENAEARRLLERARDLHDEAQEEARVDGEVTQEDALDDRWRETVRLRLDLGDVLRRLGELDEAERAYEEARARIPRMDRHSGPDLTDALRFEARVDHRVALVFKVRGATRQARPLVERAIDLARQSGATAETPAMYALLAFLQRRERLPTASWQAAREGLRVCRTIELRDERWQENVTQLLFGLAAALYARGKMVSAERSYRQASRVISEASNPYLAGIAYNGVGAVRFAVGDYKGARALFQRALRLKERAGDLHQIAVTSNNLAEVSLLLNELPAALEHARRSVHLGEQSRAGSDLADMYRNLAAISLAAGQLEEALTAARKALAIAEATGRVYLGDAALTLARVCARAAREDSSSAALRARATEAAASLRASLSEHFNEGDLRLRAEECRAILDESPT